MTIRPLADRVLVKSEEVQAKTASGIYIPETAQKRPRSGELSPWEKGLTKSRWP